MPHEKPLIICAACSKEKPRHARGLCVHCYTQLRKEGTLGPKPPHPFAQTKAERVERTCEHCHKSFSVKLSRLLIGKVKGLYCSLPCQRDSQKRPWGPSKPRPGIESWRRAVLTRDSHACQHCGTTERTLHAHHRKSWADHPDLRYEVANGLTLCDICHRAVHHPQIAD